MEADVNQLVCLKEILRKFALSTGLLVNYGKSIMVPINVHPDRMQVLASAFGCAIGSMPFTYLGLPMGTTKQRMEDLTPIMDGMERRLHACSSFLSDSAREYSSSKFYALVFQNMNVQQTFSWLWKSKCTPRIKFFGWLLLVDRLNTRNMLRRRNFHVDDGYSCAMCNAVAKEDIVFLFFDCPFAQSCWQNIEFHWPANNDIHTKLSYARRNTAHGFFMEIFHVSAWELWNIRNDKIFNNNAASTTLWVHKFKKQGKLQLLRVKEAVQPQIVQWLDSIV